MTEPRKSCLSALSLLLHVLVCVKSSVGGVFVFAGGVNLSFELPKGMQNVLACAGV